MTEILERPSAVAAMDAAFRGGKAAVLKRDGGLTRLPVRRWIAAADVADRQLFLQRCTGHTLDVGCGPGRLVGALAALRVDALGIDLSREAVRQTRIRGGRAVVGDIFSLMPNEGSWDHVLLADGNIGIGGNPARLLRRVRQLLRLGGAALVEVAPPGCGLVQERLRLRVGGEDSEPFPWAQVDANALRPVAAATGFVVDSVAELAGRYVSTLIAIDDDTIAARRQRDHASLDGP